jgi:hypothetical protein
VIQLGRTESLKERIRDVKAGAFVDGWIQDVRSRRPTCPRAARRASIL